MALQFISNTLPSKLALGETIAFSFTVKNTNVSTPITIMLFNFMILPQSETDWTNGIYYCGVDGSFGDSLDYTIKPGKTATFSYTMRLPDKDWEHSVPDEEIMSDEAYAFFQTNRGAKIAIGAETSTNYYRLEFGQLLAWRATPSIEDFSIVRGSPDGRELDESTLALTSMNLGMASGSSTDYMNLRVHYSTTGSVSVDSPYVDVTDAISDALDGFLLSPVLLRSLPVELQYEYNFLLYFGDEFESVTAATSISDAFANLHLSGCSTGGFRFGGFSTSAEGNPKGEFDYTLYPYGGIDGCTNYTLGEHTMYGKWIDGKPIYRYVYQTTTTQSGGTAHTLFTLPDVDTVLDIRGMWKSSGGTAQPVNYYVSTSDYAWTAFNTSNQLRFRSQIAAISVFIIMEYTKTQPASAPLRMIAPKTTYNQVLDDGDQIQDEQALNIITGEQ